MQKQIQEPKYNLEHDKTIVDLWLDALSPAEIAKHFCLSHEELDEWRVENPSFNEAYMQGRQEAAWAWVLLPLLDKNFKDIRDDVEYKGYLLLFVVENKQNKITKNVKRAVISYFKRFVPSAFPQNAEKTKILDERIDVVNNILFG